MNVTLVMRDHVFSEMVDGIEMYWARHIVDPEYLQNFRNSV